MSPQDKSLWLKAAVAGACVEAATWLLPVWASRASPAHPEDTIPMFVFELTQMPSILLVYLLIPLTPSRSLDVVPYAVTSVVQGFLFAVLGRFLLYSAKKK